MDIVIRVDASARIGMGHLARCRTLAAALRSQGAAVHIICRAHVGHQIEALRAEGFTVSALAAPPVQATADGDYAGWLGVTQARDAAETVAALSIHPPVIANSKQSTSKHQQPTPNARPDWLIVDHYGLGADWERTLRPWVQCILAIDDLANRCHDCDLLLDQNLHPAGVTRYRGLLPDDARALLGPTYALLRPEYAQYRQTLRPRGGEVLRILVFFGGTDPQNLSGFTLTALSDPALAHFQVDLVVGANNPRREALAAQAADRPGTRVHGPRPHLADLMAAADLAIGAGGTTTWERCCLGLPSLVVSLADNQRQICEALASRGLIGYLREQGALCPNSLQDAILSLAADQRRRSAMSDAGARLVDGQGAARVVLALHGLPLA